MADSADDPEIALQKKGRSELLRQALMKLSPITARSSTWSTITRSR